MQVLGKTDFKTSYIASTLIDMAWDVGLESVRCQVATVAYWGRCSPYMSSPCQPEYHVYPNKFGGDLSRRNNTGNTDLYRKDVSAKTPRETHAMR